MNKEIITRPSLLFTGSVKPRFVLLGTLMIATLIHIAAISFFRPLLLEAHQKSLSSPTIYLLPQDSPTSFNQWLAAQDPSVFAHVPTIPHFPKIRYTPSYASEHPALMPFPSQVSSIFIPLGPIPRPVSLRTPPLQKNPILPVQIAGTRLELAGGLTGRYPKKLPPKGILASPSKPSLPCTFLVSVNPTGEFRNIFLLHSSGNSELDQYAMDNLRQIQLNPLETEKTTWGTITYLWGLTQ